MTEDEVKQNLCYYDKRNPDSDLDNYSDAELLGRVGEHCYCDNCFYGKTALAEELLIYMEAANGG